MASVSKKDGSYDEKSEGSYDVMVGGWVFGDPSPMNGKM